MSKHYVGEVVGTLTVIEIVNCYHTKYKFKCSKCHKVFTAGFNSAYHGCRACKKLLIPNDRLRRIYVQMKHRCYSPNNANYQYWGARGIKICDEWLNDPHSFYEWAINNGYKKDLSIDRINVNGNYDPSNCRWTTQQQQVKNRRITWGNKPKEKTEGNW